MPRLRGGQTAAALVSERDVSYLQQRDRDWSRFYEIAATYRDAFKGVPEDEIEREAAKAHGDYKAEQRAKRA